MNKKKILITGGAGFVGSNLVLALQEKYPDNEYIIIDNFSSGDFNNLLGFNGEVIFGDISTMNLDNYLDWVDVVFHQAAITDTTVFDQNLMMQHNAQGFSNVLQFAKKHKAKLIYASSAAVYGHSAPPMMVGNNEKPANIYGFSKLVADNIARKHFHEIFIIGLRYFNVYGPGEKYKGKMASMIWQLYLQMKAGKTPRIFKHGQQTRDQVYVKDVVAANLAALEANASGIFNVGSGLASSFNEIVENLNGVLKTHVKPEYIDNPYQHYQENTQADLEESKSILKYVPQYDIEKGIKDYFKNLES